MFDVCKRANNNPPNYPRNYAFGKSRYVAEKDVETIVECACSRIVVSALIIS